MWPEHILPTPDGRLLWCERGAGQPAIFLHGGPGDEHRSLRPLAEPFSNTHRCILYDQRGSGGSTLARMDEASLHPDRFVDDLERLRLHVGADRFALIGHSWGATLSLLYAAAYPERLDRLALIGLGPLNDEMAAVARANLLKPLTQSERLEHARLSQLRREAIASGDRQRVSDLNRQRMALGVRAILFRQELAEQFLEDWLYFEPYRNWAVNQMVSRLLDLSSLWDKLAGFSAPTLVVYGCQDFEPITQAYLVQDHLPQARLGFINECGHVPWLEQPEALKCLLGDFLNGQ
jgi:proline iminopeptidase